MALEVVKFKSSEIYKLLTHGKDKEEMIRDHLYKNDADYSGIPDQIAGGEQGNAAGKVREAQFNRATALALHTDGGLYIADQDNHCVKMLTANEQVVVTVADRTMGLKSPSGLICCPNSGAVYIANSEAHCILRLSTTGVMELISGKMDNKRSGTAGYKENESGDGAVWNSPLSLALDLNGDLLVCDTKNNCIRKVELSKAAEDGPGSKDGAEARQAGSLPPPSEKGSVTGEDDFDITVEMRLPQPPTKLIAGGPAPDGGLEDGPALDSRFSLPSAIVVGPDGSAFVSDSGNQRLRKISHDQKEVMTLPGLYEGATGLDVDKYGRLYVSVMKRQQIVRLDPNGRVTTICSASLVEPNAVRIDSITGKLYVADQHQIKALEVVKCLAPSPGMMDKDVEDLLTQEDTDNFSDVSFQVGQQTFKGHRCIIANRCPKFKPIFKKHGDTEEPIDLPESVDNFKAFAAMMTYLYTDRCYVDEDTWEQLLHLSDIYDIDRLKRLVEEYALKRVSVAHKNVLSTLKVAHQCHANRLKAACIKLVVRNFTELQRDIPTSGLENFPDLLTEVIRNFPSALSF
mmetsp:Transcript_22464/g.49107  ORF Transcript_22464/g.49107 Transcript_22464/m.49107 type:complete len:572 (-) Transcript_22464:120-1835(-)